MKMSNPSGKSSRNLKVMVECYAAESFPKASGDWMKKKTPTLTPECKTLAVEDSPD